MYSNYKSTTIRGEKHSFCLENQNNNGLSIGLLKKDIANQLQNDGLSFRFASTRDINNIAALQKVLFDTTKISVETEYELFRIIMFGYALLLENQKGDLVGFYTTAQYNTKSKDAYGIRVGIQPEAGGHNYAALLAKLATVLAYENGCKYFRALMNPINFKSATNVLNHVGYYCETFHTDLPGFGVRFEITLPLSLDTFTNNEMDVAKVIEFIHHYSESKDYHLIRTDDYQKMEFLYKTTNFKIIAFIKEGILDSNSYYFSIEQIQQHEEAIGL